MFRKLSLHCLVIALIVTLAWWFSERRVLRERARARRIAEVLRENPHAA